MIDRPAVKTTSTYFREYGIHAVPQRFADRDFIASFPTWEDTAEALKTEMPYDGNVITPELITMPDDIYDTDLLHARTKQARDLTLSTDAMLYVGTLTFAPDPKNGKVRPMNSVHAIHRGDIVSTTHKTFLTDPEIDLKFMRPRPDARRAIGGNAVAICAELVGTRLNDRLARISPRQLFVPARWALQIGYGDEYYKKAFEEAGSEDDYYKNNLEQAIGQYALIHLPSVQRIIMSDRGRPDLPPYNAVFDRVA